MYIYGIWLIVSEKVCCWLTTNAVTKKGKRSKRRKGDNCDGMDDDVVVAVRQLDRGRVACLWRRRRLPKIVVNVLCHKKLRRIRLDPICLQVDGRWTSNPIFGSTPHMTVLISLLSMILSFIYIKFILVNDQPREDYVAMQVPMTTTQTSYCMQTAAVEEHVDGWCFFPIDPNKGTRLIDEDHCSRQWIKKTRIKIKCCHCMEQILPITFVLCQWRYLVPFGE